MVTPLLFRVSALALLLVAACAPKVEPGGYVRSADIKEVATIGKTTKNELEEKLGSPSVQSTFGSDVWYYVTDKKEAYGFMKYDTVEQKVTRIEFDDAGVVSKVEDFDETQMADISIVKRETATEGHTLGFFEQILGNIGRFNAPGGQAGPASGRRGPGR
ncbi:MAG: outer membrane protein assembly factor BamE [Rickettsiales bacterium]|nr:outer membrane protein assembly factor BamE [Rickettsiales bacterium]